MEKYGVEEEPVGDKTAGDADHCPACGALLRPVDQTGVSLCPDCGSKPFEKKVVRDG